MFARNQFELFSDSAFPDSAPAFAAIGIHPEPSHNVPTTLLFSNRSILFQKSAHLIENTGQTPICKSIVFNQLRTLCHSSPASAVFTICSPKHTGGCTPTAGHTLKTLLEVGRLNPMSLNIYSGEKPRRDPSSLRLPAACLPTGRVGRVARNDQRARARATEPIGRLAFPGCPDPPSLKLRRASAPRAK
jgi:hypothetical protein